MNRIDRLSAILIQLQSKRFVTADEISKRFNICKRTVYRDINALEESGVPLGSEPGRGYFLTDGYHLPPVMFTQEEAGSLLIAEKLIEKFTDKSLKKNYESALFKIKSVLKTHDKDFLEKIDSSIEIFRFTDTPKSVQNNIFHNILKAIAGKNIIEICYNSFYANEKTCRKIEPLGLCQYSNFWHLIAFCKLRNDYRDFRLDRIDSLKITNQTYKRKEEKKLSEFFIDIQKKNELKQAIVRFSKETIPFTEQAKYYYGIIDELKTEEYTDMYFLVNSFDYIARWLISFGNKIEIIGPDELKNTIIQLVNELSKKYLKK